VEEKGIRQCVREALARICRDADALYLSLDLDVIDPAFLPAQKYPDPAGLTAREILQALRLVFTAFHDLQARPALPVLLRHVAIARRREQDGDGSAFAELSGPRQRDQQQSGRAEPRDRASDRRASAAVPRVCRFARSGGFRLRRTG
jgi:hypothetical protein